MSRAHLDPALRKRVTVGAILAAPLAVVALTGCSDATESASLPFVGGQRVETIPASGAYGQQTTDALNAWLNQRPNERITSLTAVANRDGHLDGFQAVIQQGPNGGEQCIYADQSSKRQTVEGPQAFGAPALQAMLHEHPGSQLIITAIPAVGEADGPAGYAACFLPPLGPEPPTPTSN